ncbi:hypothetical protein NB557_02935 [Vibrio alginolyticus]|nr:hypothetical protein [Vibrio alginolyticus]
MKNLFIHIGTHKTGTTSIQYLLHSNVSNLLVFDVDYLDGLLVWHGHHALGWALRNDYNSLKHFYPLYNDKTGIISTYAYAINNSHKNNIIISDENLYCIEDIEKLKRFKSLLDDDINVKIICYVRNQVDFINSWYSELTTQWYDCNRKSYREFIENPQYETDYSNGLQVWEDIFGIDSIKVYDFDKARKSPNLESHFIINTLGESYIKKMDLPEIKSHESLASAGVEFMRFINLFDINRNERDIYISALSKLKRNKKTLRERAILSQEIISSHYQSNEKLKYKYGIDLSKSFPNKMEYQDHFDKQTLDEIINLILLTKRD